MEEDGLMRIESHPEVRRHMRKAKRDGKCFQCQHPWHDGMCLCGRWGDEEKRILAVVVPILRDMRPKDMRLKEEVERIDAELFPVKELEGLWKDRR